MGAPFAGIIDQLRRQQPEAGRVVTTDVAGRLPALGTLIASLKGSVASNLAQAQGVEQSTDVPWQGFAHKQGQNRATHPTNQPPLAFQQGFRDLRRKQS